jgi:hypothetical protein
MRPEARFSAAVYSEASIPPTKSNIRSSLVPLKSPASIVQRSDPRDGRLAFHIGKRLLCAAVVVGLLAMRPALAENPPNDLEQKLLELERKLEQQQLEIQSLRGELLKVQRGRGPTDFNVDQAQPSAPPAQAQQQQEPQQQQPPQEPVGQPPKQEPPRPEVQAIPQLGGVLTPEGTLVLEPSLQYSNSQVNRFTFLGVEILDTFLIGLIEAEDADRDIYQAALTARYGITDRLEVEIKIPYVYRSDTISFTIPQVDPDTQLTQDADGDGLGDIELGAHYQINSGLEDWPIFIANLRYKPPTGKGPFDVDRGDNGLETELATGSGFHGIEPSVTILYPNDPAVFFANVGYFIHLPDDVNETFNDQTIGEVNPGNAIRMSFGMAYSINERSSFTLGYKHDFIDETETEVNGINLSSSSLSVGSLLLGYSFQINDYSSVNLNLEVGVTDDAPDVLMTLRAPFTVDLF